MQLPVCGARFKFVAPYSSHVDIKIGDVATIVDRESLPSSCQYDAESMILIKPDRYHQRYASYNNVFYQGKNAAHIFWDSVACDRHFDKSDVRV